MRVECKHTLGRAEAIKRIDCGLDKFCQQLLPEDANIRDFKKTWYDNVVTVSFRVKKFVFGATITAMVTVNEDAVIIELELPGFLKVLLSEERLQQGVKEHIIPLLG